MAVLPSINSVVDGRSIMSKEHLADVAALAENAIIYIQYDKDQDLESMRIITSMTEENYFLAEGEESGEQYQIEYADVDLENDTFYRLQKMDNESPLLYNQGY
jgi:hypothetical protein